MPDDDAHRDGGNTTIEITFGTCERTSRVELKKRMAAFGEVDVCHMGTRGQDFPFVRFRTQASAEAALRALKNGEVFLEDGAMLAGEWKLGARRRDSQQSGDNRRRDETEDMTSRNLIHGSGRKGRSPSHTRRRSRSRRRREEVHSRRRSRSRHRTRKKSRSRHKKKSKSRSRALRSNSSTKQCALPAGSGDGGQEAPAAPPVHLTGNESVGYSNPLFKRSQRAT